jgi:hypothetical protein
MKLAQQTNRPHKALRTNRITVSVPEAASGGLSACHPLKITSTAHKFEINIFGFIQF